MKITPKEIEKYLDLLAGTLDHIDLITRDASEEQLHYKASKQDWSVRDILAHLRACSDVWGNSIEVMLADENPVLPDVHPRHWLKQTNYLDLRFRESFQTLASQRVKMLSVLRQLLFEDWGRSGVIGGRKHTVFSQARRMAKHEAEHITQISGMIQTSADRMKMDSDV
jgi:hypothetical protein